MMEEISASFRDPAGFVFRHNGEVFRAISQAYLPHFKAFVESGLAGELMAAGLLIPHQEVADFPALPQHIGKVIRPEQLPYISYAAEWSFSQLQAAALATLRILKLSLEKGFVLKDATTSNIQFIGTRPVWIDTLSFEVWEEGQPWIAYRQFCEQMLGPLALMSYRDVRLGRVAELWQEGVPLELVSRLLPWRSWFRPGLFLHLHAHARVRDQGKPAVSGQKKPSQRPFSRKAFLGLIQNLENLITALTPANRRTVWSNYYEEIILPPAYIESKKAIVSEMISAVAPKTVWDLGGNTGEFSLLAAGKGAYTVCFDFDVACVERLYRRCREQGVAGILPLALDLANPSPARGWDNTERPAWSDRGKTDLVLGLALIHHLAIGHNLPLGRLARFFARIAPWLLIEFVPKEDPRTQQLLANRVDIFPGYDEAGFRAAFLEFFDFTRSVPVTGSNRTLHLLKRKSHLA